MSYLAGKAATTVQGCVLCLLLAVFSVAGLAQDEESETSSEAKAIDEIVVIGGQKPGDEVDLDALYEEELRARLMRDLEVIKEQEAKGRWSRTEAGIVETPPRIRWGYDPDAEARMRRETDLMGVQYETTKPASLFRVEF